MPKFIPFFLFSLSVSFFFYFIQYLYPEWLIPQPECLLYFFISSSFLGLLIAFKGLNNSGGNSVIFILISIGLKMFLSLVFLLIYLFTFKVNDVLFVLNFFSFYLCFTFFEVKSLLINLRHQKKM